MGPEFFQTLMGRKFYEHDVPEIGRQLARLNDNLERIAATLPIRSKRNEKCELPPGEFPPDRGDGVCAACGYAVEDH